MIDLIVTILNECFCELIVNNNQFNWVKKLYD